MASMQMTLSYLAAPIWDPQRIAAAEPELQKILALGGPPNLALFQATGTTLLLTLPSADPAAGATLTEQKSARIDLTAASAGLGHHGRRPVPRHLQRSVRFSERAPVGEVRVTVGTDTAAYPVYRSH